MGKWENGKAGAWEGGKVQAQREGDHTGPDSRLSIAHFPFPIPRSPFLVPGSRFRFRFPALIARWGSNCDIQMAESGGAGELPRSKPVDRGPPTPPHPTPHVPTQRHTNRPVLQRTPPRPPSTLSTLPSVHPLGAPDALDPPDLDCLPSARSRMARSPVCGCGVCWCAGVPGYQCDSLPVCLRARPARNPVRQRPGRQAGARRVNW
jgi:hypothetical protein